MNLTDEFIELNINKCKNHCGEKFNSLTILNKAYKKNGKTYWLCRCECGNTTLVRYDQLTSNKIKSCGCNKDSHHVHKGDIFGRLTAIKQVENNSLGQTCWLCRCSCGNTAIVTSNHLRTGHTTSCGCYNKEIIIKSSTTHGMSHTRFYGIYLSIIQRCSYSKSENYYLYGGRGIKCLWKSFEEFKNDMYEDDLKHSKVYGEKNTSIDRVDVNGNYCKNNCRWATWKLQGNNKRNNHIITNSNGESHTIAEWSDLVHINRTTILDRLKHGYTPDEALYTPLYVRRTVNVQK